MLKPMTSAKSQHGKTLELRPELSEFNILVTRLSPGEDEGVDAIDGPSVMIVTRGEGKMSAAGNSMELKEGWVFFVGHGVELSFHCEKEMEVFRAYAE